MSILTKPSFAAPTALIFVTLGALIQVWTGVYYAFTRMQWSKYEEARAGGDADVLKGMVPVSESTWFWIAGFFLTGLVLFIIGLTIGQIGRAARDAEMPPAEATHAEAQIQHAAAVHQPQVTGGVPAAGVAAPGGVAPAPAAPGAPPAGPQYPAR